MRARIIAPGEGSSRLGLGILALAVFAFFSVQFGHNFYSGSNILTTGLAMSSTAIAVTGSAALLISGNVDLSIGGMYALVACVCGVVARDTYSTPLTLLTGIALGAGLGATNGLLVRLLNLSPLIVTIATMTLYGGLAYVVTDGITVSNFPPSFVRLGQDSVIGIQIPLLVALVIFIVGGVLLLVTRTGLNLYAIGGDERSASLSGIPVARTIVGLYAANGALIGVVALLASARLGSAGATLGTDFEFDVLTAVILGGVAFAGGAGRPIGVFCGVAMIGVVNAGLTFEGLQGWWQQIAQGGLLLVALGSDQILLKWRARPRKWAVVEETAVPTADSAADLAIVDEPVLTETRGAGQRGRVVFEGTGMTRQYGPLTGVRDANLRVHAGEILCLVGDNGAGKSTLIKMLSGALKPDAGEMRLDGEVVHFDSPRAARAAGVQTVYQDLAICGNLSVAHNMVLGTVPTTWFGPVRVRDDQRAQEMASARLEGLGVRLQDLTIGVNRLSGGQRQSVAIARAMDPAAHVVILDEPTAALGITQTASVLELIRTVAANGAAVILISHDVDTVLEVADRVVVLRQGQVVHDGAVDELDDVALIRLMSGRGGAKPAPVSTG